MSNERPQINLRAEPKEIRTFQHAARELGLSLSAWLRMVALKAAKEQAREAKETRQ